MKSGENFTPNGNVNFSYSGQNVAKNTIYNLLGYGLPLAVAVVLIPRLINGLGDERFGILNLAWIIVGYFSFLDLGIGRTLTKIIAEKIGLNQTSDIADVFWTSMFLMLIFGCLSTIIVVLFTPYLVLNVFKISKSLQPETLYAFYLLGLSIPIITTTAGLRGALEAFQKFKIINVFRVILGIFTFLVPILCLLFTTNLFWIVLGLVLIRVVIWFLYLFECFRTYPAIIQNFRIKTELIKPVLKLSGWMTVSNTIGPLITYLDRFLIGALISADAITYYATPYEVITKLLLIPGAVVTVLFPAFSSSFVSNIDLTQKIFTKSIKYIFIILFPITLLVLGFASEGLELWVGKRFAIESSLVLKLFGIGILINSIAFIPFTFLQGIGKPDITSKVHMVEFPIYLFLMWFFVLKFGIIGAAAIWLVRIIIDTFFMFVFSNKSFPIKYDYNNKIVITYLLLFISALTASYIPNNVLVKILLMSGILISYSLFTWHYLIQIDEKLFIKTRLKFLL